MADAKARALRALAAQPDPEAPRESGPESPLPPRPQSSPGHHGRWPEGWRPARSDGSTQALDYRAEEALRRIARKEVADEQRDAAIDGLTASVTTLSATITGWQAEGARRWAVSGFLAKAVGIPLLVMALAAIGAMAWQFVSTLHH